MPGLTGQSREMRVRWEQMEPMEQDRQEGLIKIDQSNQQNGSETTQQVNKTAVPGWLSLGIHTTVGVCTAQVV